MFGYQDMVVDFRGIPVMKSIAPTILDVTHSLQQPNQSSGVTGGRPELIETIARAGIATGVDGLFMETHHDHKTVPRAMGLICCHYELLEGLCSTRLHTILTKLQPHCNSNLQLKNSVSLPSL